VFGIRKLTNVFPRQGAKVPSKDGSKGNKRREKEREEEKRKSGRIKNQGCGS
jgi:hypothetical protein